MVVQMIVNSISEVSYLQNFIPISIEATMTVQNNAELPRLFTINQSFHFRSFWKVVLATMTWNGFLIGVNDALNTFRYRAFHH